MITDSVGEVAVGRQAQQGFVVVCGPIPLEVDVQGRLHDPRGPGPVRGYGMRGVLDARLCHTHGSFRAEILLYEREISRLHQVDRPRPRVRPGSVDVLTLGPDHVARLEQQCTGIGEVSLGEEIDQNADDIVAELRPIAVDSRVQGVAAPSDLGVDEPTSVGIVEGAVGHTDSGDALELPVPEGTHVRVVLIEAARSGQCLRAGPRVVAAKAVDSHHVVVDDRRVRIDCVRSRVEWYQSRGGLWVCPNGTASGVLHRNPAVDRDVCTASDHHPVSELRYGDGGTGAPERGDLGGKIPIRIRPRSRVAGVDAESEILVDAFLNVEGSAEARDDALVVSLPTDL